MTALKDGIDHYLRISRVTGTIALVMGCIAALLSIVQTSLHSHVAFFHGATVESDVLRLVVLVLIQICVVIPRVALLEATSAHAGRLAVVLSRISMAVDTNEDEAVTKSLAAQHAQLVGQRHGWSFLISHPPVNVDPGGRRDGRGAGAKVPRSLRAMGRNANEMRCCLDLERMVEYYSGLQTTFAILAWLESVWAVILATCISFIHHLHLADRSDSNGAATSTAEREYTFSLALLHGLQGIAEVTARALPFKALEVASHNVAISSLLMLKHPCEAHQNALYADLAQIHCCFKVEFTGPEECIEFL